MRRPPLNASSVIILCTPMPVHATESSHLHTTLTRSLTSLILSRVKRNKINDQSWCWQNESARLGGRLERGNGKIREECSSGVERGREKERGNWKAWNMIVLPAWKDALKLSNFARRDDRSKGPKEGEEERRMEFHSRRRCVETPYARFEKPSSRDDRVE